MVESEDELSDMKDRVECFILKEPLIDKFNEEWQIDPDKLRDLYAEDIVEIQRKLEIKINELEEVNDDSFDSNG